MSSSPASVEDVPTSPRSAACALPPKGALATREPLLEVNLRAGYGKQTVLQDVSFTVGSGERLGLVGSSGAGKSTLVMALLGLLPWRRGWAEGEVLLAGQNLLKLREKDARRLRGRAVALVPQSPVSALNSAVSLRAHFRQAWLAHEPEAGTAFDIRVRELMQQMQLPTELEFLNRKPGAVSVGQAQRIVLAMALLHRPALLIADEPTSSLDPVAQAEILRLLRHTASGSGTGLLYISHDLLSVVQLCDRLAVLHEGRIVECRSMQELAAGATHPATKALLRTLPVPMVTLLQHQ